MQNDTRQGQNAAAPGAAALREAGDDLRSTAAKAGEQASEAASRLRNEAAGVAAEVKSEAAGVAGAVQERAAGFAEEGKRAGAEQAEGFARAVRRAADELEGSSPQLARYVRDAADSTGRLAHTLRHRSLGDLVGGVEDFARRQPVAFFGAAVLAGFALSRFAKSSAEDTAAGRGGGAYPTAAAGTGGEARPAPGTSTTGAPGWVPASPGGADDVASGAQPRRPATVAAASLGGAAAHHGPGSDRSGPGRSS